MHTPSGSSPRSSWAWECAFAGDLLNECVEYTNDKCFREFSPDLRDIDRRLSSDNAEDSIFISPEYLRPYLEFVRRNKRLYRVVLQHQEIFQTRNTFRMIFDKVFSPALDRFNVAEKEKAYVIHFYLGGITSVVCEWIKNDCADSVDKIIGICMRCIVPGKDKF